MTSTKRPLLLSLEHVNTIDKDLCLSSYKLRSQSKIGVDVNSQLRGASLIFDNSEDENSLIKKRILSPSSPIIMNQQNSAISHKKINFRTETTSGKDKSWHKEIDSNELFENFDNFVEVKFSSQIKVKNSARINDLKSISKDLNLELAIESEKEYWAVPGIKPRKELPEEAINDHQDIELLRIQDSNDKFKSFREFEFESPSIGEAKMRAKCEVKSTSEMDAFNSRANNKLKYIDLNCSSVQSEREGLANKVQEKRLMENQTIEQINETLNKSENLLSSRKRGNIKNNQENNREVKNISSNSKEKLNPLLNVQFLEARNSILKNEKTFPGAPKHSESGAKKIGFI